jgi:hypothetical protein
LIQEILAFELSYRVVLGIYIGSGTALEVMVVIEDQFTENPKAFSAFSLI